MSSCLLYLFNCFFSVGKPLLIWVVECLWVSDVFWNEVPLVG